VSATVVLFEDERVSQLYPITVGRPAYAISCGSTRLCDLVRETTERVLCLVRPHLRKVHEDDSSSPQGFPPPDGPVVALNARLAPVRTLIKSLLDVAAEGSPAAVWHSDQVAMAVIPSSQWLPGAMHDPVAFSRWVAKLNLPRLDLHPPMMDHPHDVIRHHPRALAESLEHRIATGLYREAADGVFLAENAVLGKYVVTKTTGGPIVLERGASIGPYCYLSGPVHVGENTRVIEHAALKDGVALGHTTKIGGEVEASIVEAFTNKQHHGFLGHSYLGSWINLGAGTCNSDLKNTYGMVNMEYDGKKVGTQMQFVGCFVGDYAKTAINTAIFTGKTIGVCSMLYGFVTTNVPSFVNYARSFGQVTEAPVEVMVATQARMFARRGVHQRPCDIQLLHDMYELTRHERQIAGEPLSL
jgi:glucose-1-phosphate thymidylyltransferase